MKKLTFLFAIILLAACGSQAAPATQAPVVDTPVPPTATSDAPATAEAGLSFEPTDYVDEFGRFEISYPVGWVLDDGESGSRGSYIQFLSWQPEGGLTEVPDGESILQVAVYLWDPKHDLAARVEMRRTAFEASGNIILEESQLTLPSGQPAVRFVVQDTAGKPSVFVFAELGEDYVELSGYGDVQLLDEIIGTFRITM